VRLAGVQPRDVVLVSSGGRRFHAHVGRIRGGVVELTPIERGVSYRHAFAREVSRCGISDGPAGTLGAPAPAVSKAQRALAGRLDCPAAAQG
jgi:hypothetical protein